MKGSNRFLIMLAAVLCAAVFLFAGCEDVLNPEKETLKETIKEDIKKDVPLKTVSVTDGAGLLEAAGDPDIGTVEVETDIDASDIDLDIKTAKTIILSNGTAASVMPVNASALLPKGAVLRVKSINASAGVVISGEGVLKVNGGFLLGKASVFEVKENAALAFNPTVKSITVDGSLKCEREGSIYSLGNGALKINGSGSVKVGSKRTAAAKFTLPTLDLQDEGGDDGGGDDEGGDDGGGETDNDNNDDDENDDDENDDDENDDDENDDEGTGYAVNADADIKNGSIQVDKETAVEGETVKLTVTANSGYQYTDGSLLVTYGESTITPTPGQNNTFTFTMPAANVTVTAAFEEAAKPKAASPAANPPAGQVASGTTVTLSTATDGAAIHYTTDASVPTVQSAQYGGPISVSGALTIKAIAVKTGYTNSDVLTAAYTLLMPDVVVSIVDVSGSFAAPSVGAAPVSAFTATAQYTGVISWSPSNTTFTAGTAYAATVTLTAKSGYTFDGFAGTFKHGAVSGVYTKTNSTTAKVTFAFAEIPVNGVTWPPDLSSPYADNVAYDALSSTLAGFPVNTEDAPYLVRLSNFTVQTDAKWKTVRDALNDNYTKYVILDISLCSAPSNKLTGVSSNATEYTKFNYMKAYNLAGLVLPNSVKTIGQYALKFQDVYSPKLLVIPDGVTKIESDAIYMPKLSCVKFLGTLAPTTAMGFPQGLVSAYNNQTTKTGTYVLSDGTWSKVD